MPLTRRDLLRAVSAVPLLPALSMGQVHPRFQISLNERSLKRRLRTEGLDHLDLATIAKSEFGIEAVEYASQFFKDKAMDEKYLADMNERAALHGVRQLLIYVDSEARLADVDAHEPDTLQAHRDWINAAKSLGCHSIGVRLATASDGQRHLERCAASLGKLCEYGEIKQINVLVASDMGLSADAGWMTQLLERVKHKQLGTMPRFHAFRGDNAAESFTQLVPHARAITATARQFTEDGGEATCDYQTTLATILRAGYRGYVGIDYEGEEVDDISGVRAVQALLEQVQMAE